MTNHNHGEHGQHDRSHMDRSPLERRPTDMASFRRKLAAKTGKEYWRSLNELADDDAFEEIVKQEFPRQSVLLEDISRRDFLKVLGASLALAGLAACVPQDSQKIIPYVKPPEEISPAKPLYYASAMVQDGYAKGVLVQTTYGRPIKVEGNPNHPDSLGATDAFMQASLLEMYDPERVKQVASQGTPSSWQAFVDAVGPLMANLGDGAGLRILTGQVTSPSLNDQIQALLGQYSQARWTQFSPVGRGNTQAGSNLAFGQVVETVYNFQNAEVILSLDSDFLFSEPGHVRYGKDFAGRHQPISSSGTMSRLYVVESSATLTGANADHRLPVKPSQVEVFARAIASRLGVDAGAPSGEVPGQDWLDPLAADLQRAGQAALVVAGERQPAVVHALAHAMNQALGAVGNTVNLVVPLAAAGQEAASGAAGSAPADTMISMQKLVEDLNGGGVDLLVILENNPAYTAPADLNFADAMQKAGQRIYLAYYPDETAGLATWVIPAAHYMELWGDALAFDGTPTLIQPVIEPLYGGKSPNELIAALMGQADAKGYDLMRGFWQRQLEGANFERDWREVLSKGIVESRRALPAENIGQVGAAAFQGASTAAGEGLEIVFEPDYSVWDGRFSNNAWMQELPRPLTKLTWDNAALISPETAARLGLETNDVVNIQLRGRSVEGPVYVLPGQPDNVVTVSLGYGRKAGGNVSLGSGFNAYAIRTTEALWFDSGVELTKTGKTYRLVATNDHFNMENRDLIRAATMEEYQAHPNFAQEGEGEHEPATLYDTEGIYTSPDYAWGMAINLNTCIGCNACVVACQAENNIPTVGKDQVARGREMHWLRIDRYYEGTASRARPIAFQPVPCMHCETAPCEPVCPVEATSHSAEGINEMTYNRCVGTRYCSNNCPYKVRRFNFYKYVNDKEPSLKAMRNPNVTVRMRGVMEKCTYCVQRVNAARTQAEVDGRKIADGEVLTACQQACPTNAIVFGNIHDAESAVRKLKDTPLNYSLLAELGTKPRTTYLAKVRNQNPMIPEQA